MGEPQDRELASEASDLKIETQLTKIHRIGKEAIVAFLAVLLFASCSQLPRTKPASLDCSVAPEAATEIPEFLRPPTQVAEISVAAFGKYHWKSKTLSLSDLKDALLRENAVARITAVHLMYGGRSSSIANLLEVATIARTLCVRGMFERNGQLHEINIVQ